MAWKRNILVVANQTATSRELLADLSERAREQPTVFTLVCPVVPGSGKGVGTRSELDSAVARMRDQGLEVTSATLGAANPCAAVVDVYHPERHDEIIVSTLSPSSSRWLAMGAPQQIQRRTGAMVRHLAGSASTTFC
jgi:DNA-binding IclR family transcriptional regulator